MLPFLAWISAEDHCEDDNLVVDDLGNGFCRVVAVDFEHAFVRLSEEPIVPYVPPGLRANYDPALVRTCLERIQRLTQDQIVASCDASAATAQIAAALFRRRGLLREALSEWLD